MDDFMEEEESEFGQEAVKFCDHCNNILVPEEQDQKLTFRCRQLLPPNQIIQRICNWCMTISEESQAIEHGLIYKKDIKTEKTLTSKYVNTNFVIDPTMPRTKEFQCEKCGHNEAIQFLTSDQKDSKLITIFLCTNIENGKACGHSWSTEDEKILKFYLEKAEEKDKQKEELMGV